MIEQDDDFVILKLRRWAAEALVADSHSHREQAMEEAREAAKKALRPEPPSAGVVEYFRLGASGRARMGELDDIDCGNCEVLANFLEHVLVYGWEPKTQTSTRPDKE